MGELLVPGGITYPRGYEKEVECKGCPWCGGKVKYKDARGGFKIYVCEGCRRQVCFDYTDIAVFGMRKGQRFLDQYENKRGGEWEKMHRNGDEYE